MQALYEDRGFTQWYFADKTEPIGHWIDKLAALPFEAQPGERYVYGYSTDILGHVIEKASGVSLDRYLTTRVFEPLNNWVDPQEQVVAVFMSQLLPSGGSDLQEKLRVLVNQAIVGPPR